MRSIAGKDSAGAIDLERQPRVRIACQVCGSGRFRLVCSAEDIAARIPAIITSADELGSATNRGNLLTAVLELRSGTAIVSVLSADAVLLVLVAHGANIAQLLFELRRHREHIAALV